MNASCDRRSPHHVADAAATHPTPFAVGTKDVTTTAVPEQGDAEPPEPLCPNLQRYVDVGSDLTDYGKSAFHRVAPRKEGQQLFFNKSEITGNASAVGIRKLEPQFTCKICGHSFGRIGKLRSHELVHSKEKPFECKVCGRRFRQRGTLVQHERIHYPERAYQCTICMKNLTRWSILETHMLKIHKVQLSSNPTAEATSAPAKTVDDAKSIR